MTTRPTWAAVQAWAHNRTECPGLRHCIEHPKWHVYRSTSGHATWISCGSGRYAFAVETQHPTWAEAWAHANQQAKATP